MVQLLALTAAEVESIHQATLRILSEVGIVLTHPEALTMLTDYGATVDGERVYLPPELVEREVAKCTRVTKLRGRDGKTIAIGDGSLNWHNVGGARDVYDPVLDDRRPAVLQDVRDSTRILDALERATSITPVYTPQDVPGEVMSLAMYRYALPHTTKPLQGPGVQTALEVDIAVEMAAVIGPPTKVLSLGISPISPLTISDHQAGAIMQAARQGIALTPLPCPTAGATAPMSLAGALAQQSAEVLAATVLAQLVRPGLPIVYCGRLAMMEPRTITSVWGGVELALASAATVQLGHYYGLPVNVYGFSTNAHVLGLQNGFERALNAAIPALAGADELSGIGEMEAGVMSSLVQMVADDDMAGSIHRLRRGFSVDENSLAVQVIAEVMNGSRNFLDQLHTVRYLRSGEIYASPLSERRSWDEWNLAGREGMVARAQAKAERILAEHEVPPLTTHQEQALDEIMQGAIKTLVTG